MPWRGQSRGCCDTGVRRVPGCGVGVRAHLCAGSLWHLVQAHSSRSSPSTGTATTLTSSKVAFVWPRLCCRQRGLEWALERVGVGPGEAWSGLWKAPVQSWGVSHTGEEPHPCRAGLEGPRLLCSSQTPTPGLCPARSPHPITTSAHRAEEESPTAGGTRGSGGTQQEVLQLVGRLCPSRDSSVPTCGAECRHSANNTPFGTPRQAGGLSQPSPRASALQDGHPETPKTQPCAGAGHRSGCPRAERAVPRESRRWAAPSPGSTDGVPVGEAAAVSGCNRAGATCSCPGW